jgi:PEP-CTERM motif
MVSTWKLLKGCMGGVFLLGLTVSADARPITWTLSDATILGTSLTGSFVFDADAVVYMDVNISTSGGSIIPTTSFFQVAPCSLCSRPDFLGIVDSLAPDLTGANFLGFVFHPSLTDAGGTIPILQTEQGTCADFGCTLYNSYPNDPTHGSACCIDITGNVTSVPEPSSLALFGMSALFAAGALRGRLKRTG